MGLDRYERLRRATSVKFAEIEGEVYCEIYVGNVKAYIARKDVNSMSDERWEDFLERICLPYRWFVGAAPPAK